MEWQGRRHSDNLEDRRDEGGTYGASPFGRGGDFSLPVGRRGGGLSIGTIILLVVIYLVFKAMGVDLLQMVDDGSSGGPAYEENAKDGRPASNDQMSAFVRTVLAETEDTWQGIFQAQGRTYEDSKLALFSGETRSGCGAASSASGPFYCPDDH